MRLNQRPLRTSFSRPLFHYSWCATSDIRCCGNLHQSSTRTPLRPHSHRPRGPHLASLRSSDPRPHRCNTSCGTDACMCRASLNLHTERRSLFLEESTVLHNVPRPVLSHALVVLTRNMTFDFRAVFRLPLPPPAVERSRWRRARLPTRKSVPTFNPPSRSCAPAFVETISCEIRRCAPPSSRSRTVLMSPRGKNGGQSNIDQFNPSSLEASTPRSKHY